MPVTDRKRKASVKCEREHPPSKQANKKRKPPKTDSAPVVVEKTDPNDFLEFLKHERLKTIALSQQRQQDEALLASTKEKLKCLPASSTLEEINYLKKQRVSLEQTTSASKPVLSLEEFDRKIIPFLKLYYTTQNISAKLILQYKIVFRVEDAVAPLKLIDPDTCLKCNVEYIQSMDECLLMCPSCAEAISFIDASVSSVAYGDEVDYCSFSYKRITHLNEWLNHFQARESTRIPDAVLETIMANLQKDGLSRVDITFDNVKSAMKKLSLRRYYDNCMQAWCRITGNEPVRLNPVCEEIIKLMFVRIQEPFKRLCPKTRKNFLSYPFVMHAFCKMKNYSTLLPYFSLLKGKGKLLLQEQIMDAICKDVGWTYSP